MELAKRKLVLLFFLSVILMLSGCLAKQGTSEKRFSEVGLEYARGTYAIDPNNLIVVDSKLAFVVQNSSKFLQGKQPYSGESTRFVVYDGKQIGKEYRNIYALKNINGKIFFIGQNPGGEYIYYDGLEMGSYDAVYYYGEVPVMVKKGEKTLAVYDGREFGGEYDKIEYLRLIGGKPAFVATKGGKKFVVYDDRRLGKEYDYVDKFEDVGGKVFFAASNRENPPNKAVIYDGVEVGTMYHNIRDVGTVSGKLVFRAGKGGEKYIIFYDDKEMGKEYDNVWSAIDAGGKLAFVAEKGGKTFVVYDGGEKRGAYYADRVVYLDGKLGVIASKTRKWVGSDTKVFLIYDGQKIGQEYDDIYDISNFEGKLAFIARNGNDGLVFYDGLEVGKEQNKHGWTNTFSGLRFIDGKIVFSVNSVTMTGVPGISEPLNWHYKSYLVRYDENGKLLGKYEDPDSFIYVNGSYTFLVHGGGVGGSGSYIVYNWSNIGEEYGRVTRIADMGGKLAFIAKTDKYAYVGYDNVYAYVVVAEQ